jgi:hypothetical protein
MRSLAFLFLVALSIGVQSILAQDEDDSDLKPLLEKWLKGGRLPSGVVSLQTFKKATKFDGSEGVVALTFLDLNNDGKQELAIQSGCAAVGNCGLDIYEKRGSSYRKVVATDMVQTIKLLGTSRRGYRDLEFRTHGSAYDSYHRVFRFNGSKYQRNRCWNESYSILDKKGNLHYLKKPIISRGCGSEY